VVAKRRVVLIRRAAIIERITERRETVEKSPHAWATASVRGER